MPWTPDFDVWPVERAAAGLAHTADALSVIWSDGATSRHHPLLLSENNPDPATIHPKAREMCIAPTAIAGDLRNAGALIAGNGAVSVSFSDGTTGTFSGLRSR